MKTIYSSSRWGSKIKEFTLITRKMEIMLMTSIMMRLIRKKQSRSWLQVLLRAEWVKAVRPHSRNHPLQIKTAQAKNLRITTQWVTNLPRFKSKFNKENCSRIVLSLRYKNECNLKKWRSIRASIIKCKLTSKGSQKTWPAKKSMNKINSQKNQRLKLKKLNKCLKWTTSSSKNGLNQKENLLWKRKLLKCKHQKICW